MMPNNTVTCPKGEFSSIYDFFPTVTITNVVFYIVAIQKFFDYIDTNDLTFAVWSVCY